MCNSCVIEGVRQSVQSRRSFLAKSAAAGAAAVAAGMTGARQTLAQSSGKVVDLTHTFDGKFPTFDGKPGITAEKVRGLQDRWLHHLQAHHLRAQRHPHRCAAAFHGGRNLGC